MGLVLAVDAGMRTLGLLLTLLVTTAPAATDQKPTAPEGSIIAAAQVTGLDIDRLSPGLREEIGNLAGTPLTQSRLDALAARIEGERPHYVAAVRTVMDPDGQARVFFVVGRQEVAHPDDNINGRYIIDQAHIRGVPDEELSPALGDDLRALAGQRLDSGAADRLQERIERELPQYSVSRRIERGSQVGHILLVFEARKREPPPWLRFEALRTNALFHSDQGWGAFLDLGIGNRPIRFTPIVAIDDADDLVEEYSGAGLRFETLKLGTRRLGASLEGSWFDEDWRPATLAALAVRPEIPGAYDTRATITPQLKFALAPELTVSGGVSISELEALSPVTDSQMANAAIAAIDFDRQWTGDVERSHRVTASFGVRAGTRSLESDLVYTRYLGQGAYRFDAGRHHVEAAGMAGGITGGAPLFERFTLGDSRTLRGWDKYEIAPAGADRMFHSSVEYRYTGIGLFLDVGSVWDAGTERHVRASTGFGFYAGPVFFVVGFPLNTDDLRAVVTMGLRIPGIRIQW